MFYFTDRLFGANVLSQAINLQIASGGECTPRTGSSRDLSNVAFQTLRAEHERLHINMLDPRRRQIFDKWVRSHRAASKDDHDLPCVCLAHVFLAQESVASAGASSVVQCLSCKSYVQILQLAALDFLLGTYILV